MRVRAHKYTFKPYTMTARQKDCRCCERRLYASNNVRRRPLQTLSGSWGLVMKDKVCITVGCPEYGRRIRPAEEAELPILRHKGFGLDVIAWIGEKRTLGKLSLPEAHAALQREFGIVISQRHVSNLFKVFLALVHCVDADAKPLREQLIKQGKIVLSIDAVQFDETSPALYVLRDTISERVLYSERTHRKDAEGLGDILRKVKDIGVPIVGIISDKEQSQLVAVEKVFPGVPHQYCQTHFLKNVGKPTEKDLTVIAETVREAATSLRKFEKDLPAHADTSGSQAELDLVRKLCEFGRASSKASGDGIMDPAALKRFERLSVIVETANEAKTKKEKAQKRKGRKKAAARTAQGPEPQPACCPYMVSLLGALASLQVQVALAKRLRRQVEIVRKVAHILNLNTTGSQVKRILATYLNKLLDQAPARDPENRLGQFIHNLNAVANRYWPGLFHCYDNPDIPRNNNDLEREFSRFKRTERKATGRRSTAGGPLETCAEFLLEAWDAIIAMPDLATFLKDVTPDQLKAAMKEMEGLSETARTKRRINRDPEGFLSEAVEAWLKS